MKKPIPDADKFDNMCTHTVTRQYHIFLIPVITALLFFAGCENDIQKINLVSSSQVLPQLSGKNFEITYSDSGKVKVRIFASDLSKFTGPEQPYIEFPHGMKVYFYDDSLKIKSVIEAGYVKYFEEERLWEAKTNVEARNLKNGDQLNTEQLFWNERKQMIYSNTYSRIVTADGTFYGEKGFESNQDFTKWKLKGSRGTVNIKE